MKDECAGKPISETVCLRSKMYSILMGGSKNSNVVIKKSQGHNKTAN